MYLLVFLLLRPVLPTPRVLQVQAIGFFIYGTHEAPKRLGEGEKGNDWLTGWIYHGFTTMYTAKIVVNTPLDMHSMRVDGGSRLVLSRYMAMPQDVGSTLQRTKTLFSQGKK